MAKLTNKQYKKARENAEKAPEIFTFEHCVGGYHFSRYMESGDITELRQELKAIKENENGFTLEGFGNRAVVYPFEGGYILQSYYTEVACITDGKFYKLWDGFSVTTLKHINAFRKWANMNTLSKREWIETDLLNFGG